MTEIYEEADSDAIQQFILYWGDMGGQWGVNRSIAQIHALLFLSTKPLNAEDISEELGIARSNVSNSLKELVSWKLISRVPIQGDRREHFVAITDVWDMAISIARGRIEREINPAAHALEICVEQAKNDKTLDPVVLKRLKDMQNFVKTTNRWSEQMLRVPKSQLNVLLKMGDKVISLLKLGGKKKA